MKNWIADGIWPRTFAAGVAAVAITTLGPAAAQSAEDPVLQSGGTCLPGWTTAFGGGAGVDGVVAALTVFDGGSGGAPALYVGGRFWAAGGEPADHIAKWDGASWSPLGTGVNSDVYALTAFDDGSGGGPALYAAGSFTSAGGLPANRIAKWDEASWSPLGGGLNNDVHALTVFDDGSGGGPALYAGGEFKGAKNCIAKWDLGGWMPLGSGLAGPVERVSALAVFDDGNGGGPALYAGGFFTSAGGVPANSIARWDGASWSALGSGLTGGGTGGPPGAVDALTVFDDGSGGGPALYAGGDFTTAGDVAVRFIARWDGTRWSPLGSGVKYLVGTLEVFDDGCGSGPALYVGGNFKIAGGVSAEYVAKWDGASWSPLGTGMDDTVYSLAVFDDGSGRGPALYAGGDFTTAGGLASPYLARWGAPAAGTGTTYCTAGVSASGCQAALSASGVPSATAASGFALSADEVEGAKDGLFFFGSNGRQANPWGTGTSFQCVVPPVARAGLLTGTGTNGLCDGVFSQDLNTYWCPSCPKPGLNPGAGATVQAQLWYRDPLNTSSQTTSLSDAIEFHLAP